MNCVDPNNDPIYQTHKNFEKIFSSPGGPDLNYADDDANDMYQVLTTEHGWKIENIIKLIDSTTIKTGVPNALEVITNKNRLKRTLKISVKSFSDACR